MTQQLLQWLCWAGRQSGCQKSQRGVILVGKDGHLYHGANRPAAGTCDGSEECRKACPRICIHAEQDALLRAGPAARGAEVYHLKVKYKAASTSGDPSCVECSKLMLVAGVAGVWLLQTGGWRRWAAADFHAETLRTLGLPGAAPPEAAAPACPSEDCTLCNGQACLKCGAGLTSYPVAEGRDACEHDVAERHGDRS